MEPEEVGAILARFGDLSYREKRILELRYFEGHSLERVAGQYGVTKERIRQVERQALRHLSLALNQPRNRTEDAP